MKLLIKTTEPTVLKNDIIKLIEDGEPDTWEIYKNSEDRYLKHIGQWSNKGVIKLTTDDANKVLIIQIKRFKNTTEKVEDFEGYYLGRFCELMFVNFPDRFTTISKE